MDLAAYEAEHRATLARRIAWWQEAKLGLFIHYGIYSCYGRGEWIKLREGISRITTAFRCGILPSTPITRSTTARGST